MKILLLIDIDQTLSDPHHRGSLLPDWTAFFHACDGDKSIEPIIEAIKPYLNHELIEPVFVTGRMEYKEVVKKTEQWLVDRGIEDFPIFYRPIKDFSKSYKFKEKVLNKIKSSEHSQVIIIDDDEKIIQHFKSLGHSAIKVEKENNYQNTVKEFKELMEDLLDFLMSQRDNINSRKSCKS